MSETYHIGLERGTGRCGCWNNGHSKSTVVLQARRDIDCLSPNLWKYLGERVTSKAKLRRNKAQILAWVNGAFGEAFKHLVID